MPLPETGPPAAQPEEPGTPGPDATRVPAPARAPAPRPSPRVPPARERPSAHRSLLCVAAPAFVISPEDGQLRGAGMEGFYRDNVRVLARCKLLLAGREPLPLLGHRTSAELARFVAAAELPGGGPDPEVIVERHRSAACQERITVRSACERTLRLTLELHLGTDLADLGAIAVQAAGPPLAATVAGAGLRWTRGALRATVEAQPPPDTAFAATGILQWDWELRPGEARELTLGLRFDRAGNRGAETPAGEGPWAAGGAGGLRRPVDDWSAVRAESEDRRAAPLLTASLEDLAALQLRDADNPADRYLAAGVPWRCALAPAEALRAARMLLPLGTRLAAGTLRTLARRRADGRHRGVIPGTLRSTGPHRPPSDTGIEATLLFPVVLAEARRWGLPERETEALLPTAELCLRWILEAAGDEGFVPDPGPGAPHRCEVQAAAHRAAVLGAELLELNGSSAAAELSEWAGELRSRFADRFWTDDEAGGRPVPLALASGAPDGQQLTSSLAELLDTGLAAGGKQAPGLLTKAREERLVCLLRSPRLDSGWGLRTLAEGAPGYNPFGHRYGAVRLEDTATAIVGMAAHGYEEEAGGLLAEVLDASGAFEGRLPEMYAGERRAPRSVPVPHPAACRPSAVAAAAAVHLLLASAGVRPDVPGGTVDLRPWRTAPLGELRLRGLVVAEHPFSVRISRLGMGVVEEAADGLRLG